MEIISSRHRIQEALERNTYQDEFPLRTHCECGHRMIPVFSLCDDEGIFESHRPRDLGDNEFWFHDSVAIAVYLCVDPNCGKMKALWNQA